MESAVLAYSGGVDSTLLLKALSLSGIRYIAVTGNSPSTPRRDLDDARRMAEAMGAAHRIMDTMELSNDSYAKNPPDRCFHCKDELFGLLKVIAEDEGYAFVLDGSNADDTGDHRPGMRAALKHGVRSPLLEAGLSKDDIRSLSQWLGLSTWDKPASPCLSSRFPYGTRITHDALLLVSRAEDSLRALGFTDLRVRHLGETARIEVPEAEMARFLSDDIRRRAIESLTSLGYRYVTLDLGGLRSGSLNRSL